MQVTWPSKSAPWPTFAYSRRRGPEAPGAVRRRSGRRAPRPARDASSAGAGGTRCRGSVARDIHRGPRAPTAVGFVKASKRKLRTRCQSHGETPACTSARSRLALRCSRRVSQRRAAGATRRPTTRRRRRSRGGSPRAPPRRGRLGGSSECRGQPWLERQIAQAARRPQQQAARGGVAKEVGSFDSEAKVRPPPAQAARARRSARGRQLSDGESEAGLPAGAPSRATGSEPRAAAAAAGAAGAAGAGLDSASLQSLLQLRMLEELERLESGRKAKDSSLGRGRGRGHGLRGRRRGRQSGAKRWPPSRAPTSSSATRASSGRPRQTTRRRGTRRAPTCWEIVPSCSVSAGAARATAATSTWRAPRARTAAGRSGPRWRLPTPQFAEALPGAPRAAERRLAAAPLRVVYLRYRRLEASARLASLAGPVAPRAARPADLALRGGARVEAGAGGGSAAWSRGQSSTRKPFSTKRDLLARLAARCWSPSSNGWSSEAGWGLPGARRGFGPSAKTHRAGRRSQERSRRR
ncbi:unnamed protein product [Prorocentrum cordatum]|uniref:Uncharacterized protein n=1 Tax=Prorocentrum cordatum TaxID=2364126 RepID=A0ABN9SPH5_9DINO|nr:unnamed protein product [Polarella glacialis]